MSGWRESDPPYPALILIKYFWQHLQRFTEDQLFIRIESSYARCNLLFHIDSSDVMAPTRLIPRISVAKSRPKIAAGTKSRSRLLVGPGQPSLEWFLVSGIDEILSSIARHVPRGRVYETERRRDGEARARVHLENNRETAWTIHTDRYPSHTHARLDKMIAPSYKGAIMDTRRCCSGAAPAAGGARRC